MGHGEFVGMHRLGGATNKELAAGLDKIGRLAEPLGHALSRLARVVFPHWRGPSRATAGYRASLSAISAVATRSIVSCILPIEWQFAGNIVSHFLRMSYYRQIPRLAWSPKIPAQAVPGPVPAQSPPRSGAAGAPVSLRRRGDWAWIVC